MQDETKAGSELSGGLGRMIWKIIFALVVTLFLVGLWVGCWLLRGGPEGPNGWMFLPIFVQQIGLLSGCMGAAFKAFSDAA